MAVTQISQRQIRRGLKSDIGGALAEGEFAMTTDTSDIFIGAPNFTFSRDTSVFPYKNIRIATELDLIGLTQDGSNLRFLSGLTVTGRNTVSHAQGVHIEWNKTGGDGGTYILNQKGLGGGGLILGEIDTADNISPYVTFNKGTNSATFVGDNIVGGNLSTNLLSITGNMNHVIPSSSGQVAIGWNYSSGGGEASLFNTVTNNGLPVSFAWYQKIDTNNVNTLLSLQRDGSLITQRGIIFDAKSIPIGTPYPGFATTYFGLPSYPTPPSIQIPNGQLHLLGIPRGWNNNSCIVTLSGNSDSTNWDKSGAGMGGYFDFSNRRAYGGQDSQVLAIANTAPTPLTINKPITSITTLIIRNLTGNNQTIYKVTFSTPLTSNQIANIVHPMRVDTNNHYFGYIIPDGLTDSATGTIPVTKVDPAGTWILVDNWAHATDGRDLSILPPSYGPNVNPTDYGATPEVATPLGSYTVTIDAIYQLQDMYNSILITDTDLVDTAHIAENVLLNIKAAPISYNDANPLGDRPLTTVEYASASYVQSSGVGAWGNGWFAGNGIQRAFVAHNGTTDSSYQRKGFYAVDPFWGYYSVQTVGYLIGHYPGASNIAKYLVDINGNQTMAGSLNVAGNLTMANLPTSASGLPSGTVWRNGTVMNIVP